MENPSRTPQGTLSPNDRAPSWSRPLPHQLAARAAIRVLIVENEPSNRALAEQILTFAGYTHHSAANGREALEILGQEPVDLILLDLTMPVLDGFATLEILRKNPRLAHIPTIAMSGLALEDERRRAFASGCSEYLEKPYRPAMLLSVIERVLASSSEHPS
jgi:two-component system cell cycle response regulator DivK